MLCAGVINHFYLQSSWNAADTRSAAERVCGGGGLNGGPEVASSSCTVGVTAKPGREIAVAQCGDFHCAYLEVIIRVSGFTFPGIAGC